MKKNFDVSLDISFAFSAGGIGTYSIELLKALIQLDSKKSYLLLSNQLPESVPQYANQEETRSIKMPDLPDSWEWLQTANRHRLWWQFATLPRILYKNRPTLFHSVDNVTIPFFQLNCPYILTLHDIIPVTHPQFCRYRDAFAARILIRNAIKKADYILTDSHYSAEQIVKKFPFVENKIQVIYLGLNHDLFRASSNPENTADEISQHYNLHSSRFLLCVATLNPRRNLERLLQAFNLYINRTNDKDLCLVIAGCRGWKDSSIFSLYERLSLQNRVHFLNYVPENDLIKLYQSASALICPSLLEGFGLPVLEALACNTTVLCSNTTSLKEIAQDSTFQFNPTRIESIYDAIIEFQQDETAVKQKKELGLQRAQQFNWEKTAQQTIEVYRRFQP
jgi:glycosyltransferase involved in cell wall biosynthesis